LFQHSVCPSYGNDERYGISKYCKASLFSLLGARGTSPVFYRAGFLIMGIFLIKYKFPFFSGML